MDTKSHRTAQRILRTSGALSLESLKGLGFEEGDLRQWVENGRLYHPYTKKKDPEREIFMVKR